MSVIFLPFPPSVNTYWRHLAKGPLAGRVIISAKGREYRKSVCDAVLEQFQRQKNTLEAHISVHIFACRPDRRQRDLDNYLKAVLDGCTHAGVWKDDSQIHRLAIEWCGLAAHSATIPATTYELQPGLIALEITPL